MKKLKFVKIKCQCGYTNLIPAYENINCEKCGKVLAEPAERRITGHRNVQNADGQ